MLFNNVKSLSINYTFTPNLNDIDTSDIVYSPQFMAYYSIIGSDYVLMQNVEKVQSSQVEQLQPYINKPIKINNTTNTPIEPKKIFGYIAKPENTLQTLQHAVALTKYSHNKLTQLNQLILMLKNNNNGFGDIAEKVYVQSEIIKNVLVQLTNNPNPTISAPTVNQNQNYTTMLMQAKMLIHEIIVALTKLNAIIEISNISPWLTNSIFTIMQISNVLR